ncbi:uncharacterized protein Tco025E_03880 [Trypanosoma conorhini]|uniref:Uncharacterized protein n=1 Tax=Trypanosoma conorhini TaxID=83891 RepID=A0A422PQR1_9TRYP|nr:uncharacterized protein Tco025E_03880 [Trypanosoma conorhini]RNF20051.1 hypothetical protein Tco025E_03880 [Trypanosoma conorhini]
MEPVGPHRALPHHGGWAPSTRSPTTSLSGAAPTDNPYMQCFQQNPTVADYQSPAFVRRNASRSASMTERGRRLKGKDGAAPSLRTSEHNLRPPGVGVLRAEGSSTSAMEPTTVAELRRLLCVERAMRLAAERRTLEEVERGVRAAITIEANYGSRLLYSIFLEARASTAPATAAATPWVGRRSEPQSLFSAPASCDKGSPPARIASGAAADAATYRQLVEENRQLREEVLRYKSIDTEDRYEINELHRNMRAAIDRLTLERDTLHMELTQSLSRPNAALGGSSERGRISPKTTTERSSWHYRHVVDPTAVNNEESPEYACRLRILPLP